MKTTARVITAVIPILAFVVGVLIFWRAAQFVELPEPTPATPPKQIQRQPEETSDSAVLIWLDKQQEQQQAIWRKEAWRQNPILVQLEKSGVYVHYEKSKPILVNYGGLRNTTDSDLILLQQFPTLKTVSLETTPITGAGLKHLQKLPHLENLWLNSCSKLTDVDLKPVASLSKLRELILSFTNVKGEGLKYVKGLHNLESLSLHATQVTDAGLDHISSMPKLKNLWLSYTKITDQGLQKLSKLDSLRWLHVGTTKVTAKGIKTLRRSLPNLKIETYEDDH